MFKNKKKIILVSIGALSVGAIVPIAITSCSTKNNERTLFPFDGTQESIEKVVNAVNNDEFYADKSIELAKVKWTDIKWKYQDYYSNTNMNTDIIERLEIFKDPITGKTLKNVITFTFKLFKKGNTTITAQNPKTFYLDGFK